MLFGKGECGVLHFSLYRCLLYLILLSVDTFKKNNVLIQEEISKKTMSGSEFKSFCLKYKISNLKSTVYLGKKTDEEIGVIDLLKLSYPDSNVIRTIEFRGEKFLAIQVETNTCGGCDLYHYKRNGASCNCNQSCSYINFKRIPE